METRGAPEAHNLTESPGAVRESGRLRASLNGRMEDGGLAAGDLTGKREDIRRRLASAREGDRCISRVIAFPSLSTIPFIALPCRSPPPFPFPPFRSLSFPFLLSPFLPVPLSVLFLPFPFFPPSLSCPFLSFPSPPCPFSTPSLPRKFPGAAAAAGG